MSRILVLSSLMLSFSALAQDGPVDQSAPEAEASGGLQAYTAPASEQDDPNRKVCNYMVQTGSRMGRKICHTQAYWDEMELATRNKMREIDSQPIQVKSN